MKIISVLIGFTLILASCNQKEETKTGSDQLAPAKEEKAPVVIQHQVEPDSLKGSLKALATGRIGNTFVTINYHSPAVRGRVIWGGLVPLNQVWVTGAHMATSIEFEGPVQINGQSLSAGKYGFFTIPSKDEWTIIINKNWEQHLADEYKQEDDILPIRSV
jgi:hypothetical protein